MTALPNEWIDVILWKLTRQVYRSRDNEDCILIANVHVYLSLILYFARECKQWHVCAPYLGKFALFWAADSSVRGS